MRGIDPEYSEKILKIIQKFPRLLFSIGNAKYCQNPRKKLENSEKNSKKFRKIQKILMVAKEG
jgi:hypothetical protein